MTLLSDLAALNARRPAPDYRPFLTRISAARLQAALASWSIVR